MSDTPAPSNRENGVSIVIPVYNEGEGIRAFLDELQTFLQTAPFSGEVLIVDDGSSDDTPKYLEDAPFTVIRHEVNRGYGAAIKTGLESARNETVVIIDADGTYPAREITKLYERLSQYDMVVGARTGPDAQIPWTRRPAKWLIRLFAGWMVRVPIPDLNSGLRAIRRSQLESVRRLLPDGFSLTTTITVAFLSMGKRVHYEPIEYRKRSGTSKFHPHQRYVEHDSFDPANGRFITSIKRISPIKFHARYNGPRRRFL